ncbi:hypothetical protein PROVRETT_05728 [Providencia rettgeri DSM 1131]|nr:hypothetical protein PROVRETT_05728 [Providencia rettgeri DSM 1131]
MLRHKTPNLAEKYSTQRKGYGINYLFFIKISWLYDQTFFF